MKRKRIGLIYEYNESWIGGTYYIINLIKAFQTLSHQEKPVVIIFSNNWEDYRKLKKEVNYSFLQYWPNISRIRVKRVLNFFSQRTLKLRAFEIRPQSNDLDCLFPNPFDGFYGLVPIRKKIFWIPDFQEHHLPHFFSASEIKARQDYQRLISDLSCLLVLSSSDALGDFKRLYPESKCTPRVIPFAVSLPGVPRESKYDELLEKYKLPKRFFISPNQFWIHKNHRTVIEAMVEVVNNHNDIVMVFTGKEDDYRNPQYPSELKLRVISLGLQNNIRFLGFIPRIDMIKLTLLSKAVIQPSLFEGWSTVVEDAKSLGKRLIVSDIPVHREQLSDYKLKHFFTANSPEELASLLSDAIDADAMEAVDSSNYQANISNYAKRMVALINEVLQ